MKRHVTVTLASLGLLACADADPVPQALLHIRTTFSRADVDAVRVRMVRDGETRAEATIDRTQDGPEIGSLGLAPAEGVDSAAPYSLEVTALRGSDEVYSVRHLSGGFAPDRTRQHYACLAERCLAEAQCETGEVCSATGCVAAEWPNHDAPTLDWQACLPSPDDVPRIPEDTEVPPAGTFGFEVWRAGGTGAQEVSDVVVTADGTGIVAGRFSSAIDLGATSVLGEGMDGFVAAVGPDGELQWFLHFGGAGDQGVVGVGLDHLGALWVAGDFTDQVEVRRDGEQVASATASGGADVFLLPVRTDGTVGELRVFGGPGHQSARAVSARDDVVAVVGVLDVDPELSPRCAWIPTGHTTEIGDEDGFIWVSSTREPCNWAMRVGGAGAQALEAVTVGDPEITVGGRYTGPGFTVPRRERPFDVPGADDVDGLLLGVSRYGEVQRILTVGGPGPDEIRTLAGPTPFREDPIIVGGRFGAGDRTLWTPGGARPLAVGGGHLVAFGFPLAGTDLQWSTHTQESDAAPVVRAATWTRDRGAVLGIEVTGRARWDDGETTQSMDVDSDVVVAYLAEAGTVDRTLQLGGPGPDAVRALGHSMVGLVLGGSYEQTLGLSDQSWPPADGSDAWIHRLDEP